MAKSKTIYTQKREEKKEVKKGTAFSFEKFILWAHLAFIIILFALLYNATFDSKPDMNGDNFAYYILGKQLAEGKGYVNAVDIHHGPQTHFPPGYPVIIAMVIKVFGDDPSAVCIANGLMLLASALLLYFIIKKMQLPLSLAFVAAILVLLNPFLLRSGTIIMSEIPFVFFSLLSLLFLVRSNNDENPFKSYNLYLSMIFITACYLTKSTGIALFAGAALFFLFSKKWKHLAISVGSFALLNFPWYLRNKNLGSSHASQLMQINPYKPELGNLTISTFIERIENNFVRYISLDIPSSFFGITNTAEKTPLTFWILGILAIAVMLFGILKLKDFKLLFLGYLAGTFAILLIWPDIWGGIRFIEPLLPVGIFLGLFGLYELLNWVLQKANLTFNPYFFLLFGFLFLKPIEAAVAAKEIPLPMNYQNYFEIAKWCKQNLPKDAVISARKADMFLYYSDRMTIGDKPSLDDKEVLDFFRKNGVDYVVLEQLGFASTQKYLLPAIQKNMDKFEQVLVLPNPDTYLLKFKEGDR